MGLAVLFAMPLIGYVLLYAMHCHAMPMLMPGYAWESLRLPMQPYVLGDAVLCYALLLLCYACIAYANWGGRGSWGAKNNRLHA
eukprot:5203106-Karenia_brevis.AAC.1